MLRAVSNLGRTSTLSSIFLGVVVRGVLGREERGKALRGLLTLRVPTILGEAKNFLRFSFGSTLFFGGGLVFFAQGIHLSFPDLLPSPPPTLCVLRL